MLQEILSFLMVAGVGWFGYRCASPRGRETDNARSYTPLPFLARCPLCGETIYAFRGDDYEEALALAEVSHFEKTGHFGELIAFSDVPPRRLSMPPTKPLPPPIKTLPTPIRSIMLSRSESEKRFGGIRPPPPAPMPRNVAMSDLMSDREEGPTHSHFFNNTCLRCVCGLTLEKHASFYRSRALPDRHHTEPIDGRRSSNGKCH